tara:strand:+ start:36 stop:323 length:288 start_codon:yes stop_codon:yes gene_type:complete
MKNEDIIGREIKCFRFESMKLLTYNSQYKSFEGLSGVVLELHTSHPEFARVAVKLTSGTVQDWHYPTEMIIEQLEELDKPVDMNEIFLKIKNLIT